MPNKPAAPTSPAEISPPGRDGTLAPFPSRKVLVVALAFAAVWILGLILLTLLSANPVTLNLKQILQSDFVATATRPKADALTLSVRQEWKRSEDLGEIVVENLDEAKMPAEGEFLVPLLRVEKNRYLVTPTTLPNDAPLIYPATPEAKAQLQDIIDRK